MTDDVTATEKDIEEFIFNRRNADVFIAQYDGLPVGFALFFENFSTFTGKPGLYLEDIFVDESMRKKGIGKALFQAVVHEAIRRGSQRLEWSCLDWNTSSIAFYKHMGAVSMNGWTTYRLSGKHILSAAEK